MDAQFWMDGQFGSQVPLASRASARYRATLSRIRTRAGGYQGEMGDRILDRSFEGTYR